MLDLGLAGKVAIVTGGSGGLGLAFAESLVDAGAKVAIADIKAGAAEEAAAKLRERGEAIGFAADVSDEVSAEAMVARTRDAFGALDILVNNAGIYATLRRAPFYEISVEEWDRVMAVNLRGVFLCAKAAAKHMIAAGRGGRIINIASATVFSGSPLWMHYVASKGGVIGMTRVMARELGDFRHHRQRDRAGLHADGSEPRRDRRRGNLRGRARRHQARLRAPGHCRRLSVARLAIERFRHWTDDRRRRRQAVHMSTPSNIWRVGLQADLIAAEGRSGDRLSIPMKGASS